MIEMVMNVGEVDAGRAGESMMPDKYYCNGTRPDKHINDRPEGNDGENYYSTHNEQKFLVFTEWQHAHIVLLLDVI